MKQNYFSVPASRHRPASASAVRRLLCLVIASAAALPFASAVAQTWPERTVRVIIPFPPGGAIDTMTRILAPRLEADLKQPVVVENRPGAGGVVGTEAAARATDGHTILMTAMGHVIAPALHAKLSYDAMGDFKALAPVAVVPNVLVVPKDSPYNSVQELLAAARANPGKLTYGSAGTGTSLHMAAAMFAAIADVNLTHVPYRGSAPAVIDLVAGRIDMMFDSTTSAAPFVTDGRLKPLAVATSKPTAAFPGLPTIGESGVPGYAVDWWYGFLAPKSLPPEAINRFAELVAKNLNDPEVQDSFRKIKVDPMIGTPASLQSTMQSDAKRWGDLVRELGIQPN